MKRVLPLLACALFVLSSSAWALIAIDELKAPRVQFPKGITKAQQDKVMKFLKTKVKFVRGTKQYGRAGATPVNDVRCTYSASTQAVIDLMKLLSTTAKLKVEVAFDIRERKGAEKNVAFTTSQNSDTRIFLSIRSKCKTIDKAKIWAAVEKLDGVHLYKTPKVEMHPALDIGK